MSWTVTLTRSPARCTPPSRMLLTPSCCAICCGAQVRRTKTLDRGARDHLERADLRELRQDVVVDAVDEEGVVLESAAILERQDGDRRAGVSRGGRCCAMAGAAVVGVSPPRWYNQKMPPPTRKSSVRIVSSGADRRCWPRSPWYQARTSTIGSPIRSARVRELLDLFRPVECHA